MLVNRPKRGNKQKVTNGPVVTNRTGLAPNRYTALVEKEVKILNVEGARPLVESGTKSQHVDGEKADQTKIALTRNNTMIPNK